MPSVIDTKGGVFASFFFSVVTPFFVLIVFSSVASAEGVAAPANVDEDQLAQVAGSTAWHSLIHYDGKRTHITDSSFLLSEADFSPGAELRMTLELLNQIPQSACRFPARYLWLSQFFKLPETALDACSELKDYEVRAPADEIALIFASENLGQPSSMMGHVLIKIQGLNEQEEEVSHAITFYTEVRGFNVPKLFYDSIIKGKTGYFALSPYRDQLNRYNLEENRNVWEYQLDLDEHTKKVIQYHFFELRQTELVYYFDKYNCATLTQFVLGIADISKQSTGPFWVTPLDTIRSAADGERIGKTTLTPSPRWKIRMLSPMVSGEKRAIKSGVDDLNPQYFEAIEDPQKRFVSHEIAQEYIRYLKASAGSDRREELDRLSAQLTEQGTSLPDYVIDISEYKSPLATPKSSQISMGIWQSQGETSLRLDFLPASHKLMDDNRQYFGDTELTLGEFSVIKALDSSEVKLNAFTLYGVKSLIPRDPFTGGLSGAFSLGVDRQYFAGGKKHSRIFVEGGLGLTATLTQGISVFGLPKLGVGHSRYGAALFYGADVGTVIEQPWGMKSMLTVSPAFSSSAEFPDQLSIRFDHAFYAGKDWAIFVELEHVRLEQISVSQYGLALKRYF